MRTLLCWLGLHSYMTMPAASLWFWTKAPARFQFYRCVGCKRTRMDPWPMGPPSIRVEALKEDR